AWYFCSVNLFFAPSSCTLFGRPARSARSPRTFLIRPVPWLNRKLYVRPLGFRYFRACVTTTPREGSTPVPAAFLLAPSPPQKQALETAAYQTRWPLSIK
ncbi:unnamed protein product, partial [Ectocarpus sp. 4 AP-2014]